MPADHNKNIVRQLLCLRTRLTTARHSLLEQEMLKLPMAKVTYFGTPAWRHMKVLSNELGNITRRALAKEWPPPLLEDSYIKHFIIHCPTCATNIQVARRTVWTNGKWVSILCHTCAAARTARLWTCPCKVPWSNCSFHAPMGYRCGKSVLSKRRAPTGINRRPKRTCIVAPIFTISSSGLPGTSACAVDLHTRDQRISTIRVRNCPTRPRSNDESQQGPLAKRPKPASSQSRPKRKRTHGSANASTSRRPPPRSRSAPHNDAIAAVTRLREARSVLPRALTPQATATSSTEGPFLGPR